MNLLIFALIGSVAQLIDGTLGMGFGISSSTLLLTLGATAAASSAAVHFAEIATTLSSGASHWRFENVDKKILFQLALPGGIGALSGATFLSFIDLQNGKIFVSSLLLLLGALLIFRNLTANAGSQNIVQLERRSFIASLGFTGGFVDAAGGGGWGPIVTPTLMSTTTMETRKIVGTVSASEFVVATMASVGFLLNIHRIEIDWLVVAGLAIGGAVMAPLAAKLVSTLNKRALGLVVGIGIVVINAIRILTS